MNKNQNLWLVLSTGISLVALGCSSEGGKPNASGTSTDTSTNAAKIETPKFTAEQQGTYETACSKLGDWGSLSATNEIGKSEVISIGKFYETADCSGSPYLVVKLSGFVERIGGTFGEGTEVDTRITAVTYTASNERGVEIANESQLCEISEWKLNVDQDVSGQNCYGVKMPAVGSLDYSILRFQGNELQIGLGDSEKPDTRPEKLDPQVFKKIQ